MFIKKNKGISQKLALLSRDSQYDLACACATRDDEHRRRSEDNRWIYPVTLQDGRTTYLFKTLLSNECVNNCKYCPLRAGQDVERCSFKPEDMSKSFLSYYNARMVSGLFLSSGVMRNPDSTMEHINRVALDLRRRKFRGYIHLKVIPGSSDAAIEQSLRLANAVSLNIETPGEDNFKLLSTTKNYTRDILRPIELISRLTRRGARYSHVKQTTQFVIGASKEKDRDIIRYTGKLYRQLKLSRVYFSAYQRGEGSPDIPGEGSRPTNAELLTREHRLYQTDWLIRKYGFEPSEIPVDNDGNLSLTLDPKEMWARQHPEFFPVNVNQAERDTLLRVPGFGEVTVDRILAIREQGSKVRSIGSLGRQTKVLKKASVYIKF